MVCLISYRDYYIINFWKYLLNIFFYLNSFLENIYVFLKKNIFQFWNLVIILELKNKYWDIINTLYFILYYILLYLYIIY